MVARVTTIEGRPSPATSRPLQAPSSAPTAIEAGTTSLSAQPRAASSPAQMLHTENCEPTEMSICRLMMTNTMPQATTSVGASRVTSESSGWGWKKPGANTASASRTTPSAIVTEISRK